MYLGIDIGATNIKYLTLDNGSEFSGARSLSTDKSSYDNFIRQIAIIADEAAREEDTPVSGAGIAMPGFLDFKSKIIEASPNITFLKDKPIWADLAKTMNNTPFVLENDANAAAFGEYAVRRKKNESLEHMILITLGSGVGGGIIIEGELLHGSRGFAGEIGHIKLFETGRTCGCGAAGCVEPYLGAQGIVNTYMELGGVGTRVTPLAVAKLAGKGDRAATETMKKTAELLGLLISVLINIFNPQIIAVGGGIMNSGKFLLPGALKIAEAKSIPSAFRKVKIEKALLGNDAGAYGAAEMIRKLIESG